MATNVSIQPFIRKMIVLKENQTVEQAAHAMRDRRVGCIVLTDGHGHISGIVTDRDLVSAVLAEGKDGSAWLSEVMTSNPSVVDESSDLLTVIGTMKQSGVRRIPVIRQTSPRTMMCVGIVTLDDLVVSEAIDRDDIRDIVRAQMLKRAAGTIPTRARTFGASDEELESFYSNVINRVQSKFDLTVAEVEVLTDLVLGNLIRRLHHTAAMQLTGQLPRPLQSSLAALPQGPDHRVTSASILSEIASALHTDDAMAYAILTRFCAALEDWCDLKELQHVKAQLPRDIRAFFVLRQSREAGHLKAA